MKSPNLLDLSFRFAKYPLSVHVGPEVCYSRKYWNGGHHCNADFEVHILLAGSCVIEVGHQTFKISQSEAMLIPPGVYHCLTEPSADFEWFCFCFSSKQKGFSQALLAQINSVGSFPLSQITLTMCRMILDELTETYAFSEESLSALFMQLLVKIFRGIGFNLPLQATVQDTTSMRTAVIDDFFSHLQLPFGTEEELAASLNLSCRQLNRVLMQYYGMGFQQKMMQARMEYAKKLLRTTEYKAGEIGDLVGYIGDTSFYKAFQNYYRMTPQQYRESQK